MNDRDKIENSIIPMMIYHMIRNLTEAIPEQRTFYEKAMRITLSVTREYMHESCPKKEKSLHRRLERVTKAIYGHFTTNKFDTRKGLLVLILWAYALAEQEALHLRNKEYTDLLEELDATFAQGQDEIENFDKILLSAQKHVPKIHSLIQNQGYF